MADHSVKPNECGTNFNSKPTPEQRSVKDALKDAERQRNDLPHVVQVYARDWDKVILADAYLELRELAKALLEDCDNSCWPTDESPIRIALEE